MYTITDYILRLVKTLPKEPVDMSIPVADQIDYEDHEKIVDALHRAIESGNVMFYGRPRDLREVCESYVVSCMTHNKTFNPLVTEEVVPEANSDFILNKLLDSLNETDPESLLFEQLEKAIERRKNIVNSNLSKTNLK